MNEIVFCYDNSYEAQSGRASLLRKSPLPKINTTYFVLAGVEKMGSETQEKQVVSKQRVVDHGEVYTNEREVNAMLDLVKRETERIESRFLEPACGTGNFVTEILERKLHMVKSRYGKSQLDYERNAVLAISSVYGIDILKDNVLECRERLFKIFDQQYSSLFAKKTKKECKNAVQFILEKNIIWGDALTLKTVGDKTQPIIFSEWSPVNGSMLKRRDFAFYELLPNNKQNELPLFSQSNLPLHSDLGSEVFIPSPVKDYPAIHFMRVSNAEQ